jgi:hypothetical protein
LRLQIAWLSHNPRLVLEMGILPHSKGQGADGGRTGNDRMV